MQKITTQETTMTGNKLNTTNAQNAQAAQFVHLHLHTEYSLLDSTVKIDNLAKALHAKGMNAAAITDHGNMFGAIDFYKTMRSNGIKPIIGLEAYIHNYPGIGTKEDLTDPFRQRFHLCLLAKNEQGYKNLMRLSSESYLHGFYYYPRFLKATRS
ncbi:hypothetical protein FACS189487_01270 [Campylobacterota bacterium]|nr:hypothetical protein FACS189487_01270 [Campylobacterota bacterium]